MSRTLKTIIALIAAGVLLAAVVVFSRPRSIAPVLVKVRIAVTPQEQSGYVLQHLNSARFKYLAGKQAGVAPTLAQKLSAKPVPNSSLLEAQAHLPTRDDAQKYLAGFLETLQLVCGTQAQVAVTDQFIR